MIRSFALAGMAVLAGTAAQADPRIATRIYEPASVVVVHGQPGVESTIAFADDERIENVAVGDSAKWQVTPNKRANLLFVKPAGLRARSNMTVVTDQHTYLFDLVSGGAAPVYMLRFTYAAKPRVAAPAPIVPAVAMTPVAPPIASPPPPNPADLNFAWTSAGDKAILPSRTFDDGRSTFLSWPKDAALPAVLTRTTSGQEGPVNFTVQGDYLVVDGVPPQLILRAGKAVATLTPHSRPATQTASAQP
jgi:type IV secretion system protein VirB9